MSEIIFATKNLTKKYHQKYALNGVTMTIRRGDIYGFVGENGAGKTTLMRILVGMAVKTGGEMELFGEKDTGRLYRQRVRMGGIIEAPALYLGMTASDNLEVVRRQLGIKGKGCIQETLKLVDLQNTGNKKAKDFSLGMKQRLGLAMALIGDTEFLILDEPINGLDPKGIVELRELLKKLNQEKGISILISSHLLSELHLLATSYGFIHNGRILEEIRAVQLQEKLVTRLTILVDDAQKAAELLKKTHDPRRVEIRSDVMVNLNGFSGNMGDIMKLLLEEGVTVKDMKVKESNLEEYYMTLIKQRGV